MVAGRPAAGQYGCEGLARLPARSGYLATRVKRWAGSRCWYRRRTCSDTGTHTRAAKRGGLQPVALERTDTFNRLERPSAAQHRSYGLPKNL